MVTIQRRERKVRGVLEECREKNIEKTYYIILFNDNKCQIFSGFLKYSKKSLRSPRTLRLNFGQLNSY